MSLRSSLALVSLLACLALPVVWAQEPDPPASEDAAEEAAGEPAAEEAAGELAAEEEAGELAAEEEAGEPAAEEEAVEPSPDQDVVEPPEDEPVDPLPIESLGPLSTVVGVGRLVTFPARVLRMAMADSTLARIQVISGRELLVTAVKPGRTSLYLWLSDGRRLSYVFQADPDVELAELVLMDLDPAIEIEVKGDVLVLRGEVSDDIAARAVRRAAELVPGVRVIDLLSSILPDATADERLEAALQEIDERIEVRRVQVGPEPDPSQDTYILEGRVRTVDDLVRAMTVAERQLGESEIGVVPVEGGQELALRGFAESETQSGLAAQISRGLDLMSPSGRVISFLEVDDVPQILVRVKVLEVDRSKARNLGIDLSIVGDRLSLPALIGAPGLAIDYVDDSVSITAFIDFLESKALARSVIEPSVLTLSGEQATIVVGGQVPIPSTAVGNVTTVQGFRFQEFGVQLGIRPTLIEGDIIALDVSPSVSRPTPGLGVSGVPGFSFQAVRTQARVHAGQSLVVGGLLSFSESMDQTNLPWLRKLPIFRSKRRTRAETELLFVITPRFISIDPAEPVPPVPATDPETLGLPELDWPFGRDKWSDEFEPQEMWPDGVPPSLRRGPLSPIRPLEAELAPEVELAPEEIGLTPEIELMLEDAAEEELDELAEDAEAAADAHEYRFVGPAADPCLNLRPDPNRWFAPYDCLPPGTRVLVLGSEGTWSRVVLPSGQEGWMASRFLDREPTGSPDAELPDLFLPEN